MSLPRTLDEVLTCVTKETARMSYPASMSRGKKPVVAAGTKKLVESHLILDFPILDVWDPNSNAYFDFETWHKARVEQLASAIKSQVLSENQPLSVAAKFINTFLHQLTKYEEARPLVQLLHLPLDSRVFAKLRRLKSPALSPVKVELKGSPYGLSYDKHLLVQQSLLDFVEELNARSDATFKFSSRIELNWLWL